MRLQPGKVVFAAPLTVRGNATIIDHGWGVYSGFWHQSQILVNVGDMVEQGQVIGFGGRHGPSHRRAPALGGVGKRHPGESAGLAESGLPVGGR